MKVVLCATFGIKLLNIFYKPLTIFLFFQHEIKTLNKMDFKKNVNWLQMLTQLIEDWQDIEDPEAVAAVQKWMLERDQLRFVLLDCMEYFLGLKVIVVEVS